MIDGENCRHLKSEFQAIDKQDASALRMFFDKYSHLSNNQLSRIVDINNLNIRRYKKRAGLHGHNPKHRPRNLALTVASIPDIPADVTNEDLEKHLTTYSINQISKATGIPLVSLWERIKRNNLKYRSKKQVDVSRNPCCNYEWLYKTYFLKYRSCVKCGKLAGVYPQTISSWLNKFKIPLLYGPSKVVWLSNTLRQLHMEPMVGKVVINDTRISISYKGYKETYYYNKKYGSPNYLGRHFNINEKEFTITKQPRVNFKYYSEDINNPNDTVLSLSREEFNTYNFIERRLAIHRFMHALKERGYKIPILPDAEIQESIDLVRNVESSRYRFKGKYVAASEFFDNHAGKKLILTHYDLSEIFRGIYNSKVSCYPKIARLLKKTKYSLDEISLQMTASRPRWFDYILLAEMIKDLGFDDGPILDLSPRDRFVSMTAARLGVPIYYPDIEPHMAAMQRGYFDKLGIQAQQWDGQKVNYIIAIYFDRYPELEEIKKYLKYTKRLIIVPRIRDRREFAKVLPPKARLDYVKHPLTKKFYYIFTY